MKRILFFTSVVFLAACAGKSSDKKSELEKLKKERVELNSNIAKLEKEVGIVNATANSKNVTVYEVTETIFKNYLEVQGKIDAEENVQVNPETPGVVTSVYVNVGQNVSKGQVLAQLDDKVLRQNIAELNTQLDLATNLYNRQKNLWDQKIGTEVQFISARTQKVAAERRIATLNSQISMYKIKSPISGTIDAMDLKVGEAVMPGMSGIRVINASKLKAKALVAESYAGRVNQGDRVMIILPDLPDTLNSRITFASKTIEADSRSFNVEVKLPSSRKYRPNMLAVLKIVDYENDKALIIPVNAILKSENGEYVFIAENGKAKRVTIQSGKVSDGKAEILAGLKPKDQVITTGIQEMNNGDIIKF